MTMVERLAGLEFEYGELLERRVGRMTLRAKSGEVGTKKGFSR